MREYMKYFIFMLTFCDIYVIIIKTKIVYENFNELKSRGELDLRKKILATALVATMVFGLVGCGSGSGDGSQASNSGSDSSA